MVTFKDRCLELRERGFTLAEIVRATKRPKTSVYFHIRGIRLSEDRLSALRKVATERICSYSTARKGKSEKAFTRQKHWTPATVLLIAHLIFDGEIRRAGIYNNRSKALLDQVERCMKSIYSYGPTRYTNTKTGVSRISFYNVELATYLSELALELKLKIPKMPLRFQREFLRAFFDDEGCIDFRPESNRRKVRGYQKDVRILKLVQMLLSRFYIASQVVFTNEVVISGKENLQRFEKEVNFSPGIYMNGGRRNSRWKKDIEKRVLLRRAITSFKS